MYLKIKILFISFCMLEIKRCPVVNGYGVFTTCGYEVGDVVLKLSGKIVDAPTRESIEISQGRHVIDSFGSYVNHSFTPTTRVDVSEGCLVAIQDLEPGSQITFNYNESESSMACPFQIDGVMVSGKDSKVLLK
jgi:hypothetical protein